MSDPTHDRGLWVDFVITTICQYKCDYCIMETIQDVKGSFNILYDFNDIDKDVKMLSEIKKSTICLSGGEPTLHPKCNDIVLELLDKTEHNIIIYTNGTNIDKLKELPVSDRLRFEVSCHLQYYQSGYLDNIQELVDLGYGINVILLPYVKFFDKFKMVVDLIKATNIPYVVSYLADTTQCIHEYTEEESVYLATLVPDDYPDAVSMDVFGKSCNSMLFFMKGGKLFSECFGYEYKGVIERGICKSTNCVCSVYDIIDGILTLHD